MDIRLSTGSAVQLGLKKAKMDNAPTTLYTLLGETCLGNCSFCTQAKDNQTDRKFLSRVTWPHYDFNVVLERLEDSTDIGRICVQTLKYADLLPQLLAAVAKIHTHTKIPLSICMNPADKDWLLRLKDAGVERVGVGLDCATRASFSAIKAGFSWQRYLRFSDEIVDVFGTGSVHLIVGLGDSDAALLRRVQDFHNAGASVALFAYTPVRGTRFKAAQPAVERYRTLQLTRYLIDKGQTTFVDLSFREGKLTGLQGAETSVERAFEKGTPFRTSGCPSCNRPQYNERPGGTTYNYPRPLLDAEKQAARALVQRYWER